MQLVTDQAARGRTLETFRSLVGQVRGQPGCVDCQLLEDVHESGNLIFRHTWDSEESLHLYTRSPWFRGLLAGIDMASEEPDVRVHTEAGVRGMDYFREQRGLIEK
jgi:quinol monooxygenase YgiN